MQYLRNSIIVTLAALLCSCSHAPENRFAGNWETSKKDYGISFLDNKTGVYYVHDWITGATNKTSFTYEVRDATTAVMTGGLAPAIVRIGADGNLRGDNDTPYGSVRTIILTTATRAPFRP